MTRATFQQGHDPKRLDHDERDDPLDLKFTPAERDIVQLARIDIEANKRQFGRFTEGLYVTELSADDLSPEQHRALFGEDHD